MAITSNYTPTPAPMKQTLASAYLDFTTGSGLDWSQQYVPDLMEKEAEVFGQRTISGFLSQVGAEESMTADQVVWSEQSRLHLSCTVTTAGTGTTFTVTNDADGTSATTGTYSTGDHGIRAGDMVILADANATLKFSLLVLQLMERVHVHHILKQTLLLLDPQLRMLQVLKL